MQIIILQVPSVKDIAKYGVNKKSCNEWVYNNQKQWIYKIHTLLDFKDAGSPQVRFYCKTGHTYIHVAYSTVDTLPPPHNYVPHAKAFSNDIYHG